MPETIRTANERLRSRAGRVAIACLLLDALDAPARAGGVLGVANTIQDAAAAMGRQEIATLTLTLGLLIFAVLASIALVRTRKAATVLQSVWRDEATELRTEADRFKALLMSEPQVLVAWAAARDETEILGDTTIVVAGHVPERVLAFGAWLEPAAAQRMQHAVDTLRADGRGFVMTLTTTAGRPLEAEGRAVGGRAILRLRDVSGIERELIDLAARHDKLMNDVETMKALLDSLPAPVWARDDNGRLVFVNQSYARAVEAKDANDAVAREVELLDRAARDELNRSHSTSAVYSGRLPAIAAGQRRIFDVVDAPSGAGSAGMAIDRTEVETMRSELARMIEAHRRVLDQLATGVA
ncbi:MAG: PAS domain-containing protein, partial [Pseudolabrys sp.]